MDDARTSARVRTLRAACALPLARVYGSLEGRLDGAARVALEPDGRHAAVVLDGAIERWDLDAIERVGRWEAPAPSRWGRAVCVGEAPAGLRLETAVGLWRPAPPGASRRCATTAPTPRSSPWSMSPAATPGACARGRRGRTTRR